MNDPNVHAGHRKRVKNSFLTNGFAPNVPPHKILEMLLFYAIPRKDTNEIAHALIQQFGSLAGVLEAPVEELMKVKGVSENSACLIKMILPIARRYKEDKNDYTNRVLTHGLCIELLSQKFFGFAEEMVYMLFLDNTGRMINCEKLAEGSNASVRLSLRTVVERVVKSGATAVIISHNHPVGYAIPSDADCKMTRKLYEMLRELEVQLLDHVIFAGDDCVSMVVSKQYKHLFEPG